MWQEKQAMKEGMKAATRKQVNNKLLFFCIM